MLNKQLNYISLSIFALVCCFTLHAQGDDSCTLPPPATLTITQVSSNSLTAAWSAVPGAVAYQVTTWETDSGALIDLSVTSNLSTTINGLNADTEYTIEVRASACPNGPWGEPIVVTKKTSIIIVDIVFQLDCDPGSASPETYGPTHNPYMLISMPPSEECVLIAGNLTVQGGSEEFGILIHPDQAQNKVTAGLVPGSSPDIFLNTSNMLLGEYTDGASNVPNLEFVEIVTTFTSANPANPAPTVDLNVHWKQDVDAFSVFCSSCSFGKPDSRGARKSGQAELQLTPNPVSDRLNIAGMDQASTIQIVDLQGQLKYQIPVSGTQMKLDISSLPTGYYFLRTLVNNEPMTKRFVKI